MDGQRRARLEIDGKVQGVFFRASTREKARELGVNGWVKNRRDGSVQAVFEGPENAVEGFVQWAYEGPSRVRVEDLEVHDEEYEGEFTGFEIRR